MRILFVVHSPQRIGGAARSADRIVAGLRALGHYVEVVAPDAGEAKPSFQQAFQNLASGQLAQQWTRRVSAAIEETLPELLVGFYGSQGAFSATAAARLAGLPVVACLRGNDVNLDFFSPLQQPLVAFAAQRADAVAAVSREMCRKVEAFFGVEATFIGNSVDLDTFRPDPQGAARLRAEWRLGPGPVVGVFGEMKPAKGLAMLAGLEEALRGATTLVVGTVRPESRRELPAWVREIPYLDDRATLRAAYGLCDLVLQPSLDEGMPNTVLEAMACERVVVAARTGGLLDALRDGETGFLCRPDEWPGTVAGLLAAPRPEVGVAARRSLPSPADEAAAYEALFRQVLARYASSER